MALGKLDFGALTKKHLAHWEAYRLHEFDQNDSKKKVYSIDSPPPFTSGALHMGHMLSYAYFDFAARFKRMQGFNVFYPQGWDCQGFPTEVKVEKKFGRGLSRKEFKEKCVEFTLQNIEAMKHQMHNMGFSPDWRFEYRTMDPAYHKKVQHSLLQMYEKGLVYRAKHPVLFCTNCRSAIAKAETEEKETENKLNHIEFTVAETGKPIVIATTRPELMHACVALFIHPEADAAKGLEGKHATIPLYNRQVPIVFDSEVEKDFGTGALMVCSYGDKDDVTRIFKYKLQPIEALGQDGRIVNSMEGFNGLSINAMREKIIETLKEKGKLVKQVPIKSNVKVHDRCGKPVDFLATMQWFIKLKDSSEKIVAAARKMRWTPGFSIQYLIDWAEFIDYDWVISRQRVYGTPIPFYYCDSCTKAYPADYKHLPIDPAQDKHHSEKCECGGAIIGETSTCDCWVDSSITPLTTSGWPDNPSLTARTYPATLRPQGLEIIRTWAFYTIARCLALTGEIPFEEVLINGSVLGTDGKKMSKSAGNYEDPDALMAKYAPDALRQWAALSGAVAKDRPFSPKDIEYSQSFMNKLYNAAKFAEKALEGYDYKTDAQKVNLRQTDAWLLSRTAEVVKECTVAMNEYDYYTAINAIQGFAWHELCDYYLEEVKYRVYSEEKDKAALDSKKAAQFALYHSLNAVVKVLAPFAPFVTDEIYGALFAHHEGKKSVHACSWPSAEEGYINKSAENIVGILHAVLGEVRRFKAGSGLALNEPLTLAAITAPEETVKSLPSIEEEIRRVGHLSQVNTAIGHTLKVELTL